MSASERSPLARLVLFMTCLAILGSALAGAHYYTVDLPMQNTVQVPGNSEVQSWKCSDCTMICRWTRTQACYDLCKNGCT